ncbi:hybrid sensor histidine kinase/response regulator transcription factor [Flagellimonas sp.]|uniref:hybrid sensor histidine kinase/response regulator transcription factor n=1 Tax=Flagellimonas sp. TaxID=2058762 RepID=UPI003F4A6C64
MKTSRLFHSTFFFLVILTTISVFGQNSFQLLRTYQLPNTEQDTDVFAILRDTDGFMWFGTSRGLYKFDGMDYTVYRSRYGDANSLTDNEVWALMQDSQGRLWIGTKSGGISVLNIEKEVFKHYRESSEGNGIPDNFFITSIFEDSKKNIWISSNGNGLGRYMESSDSFQYYNHDKDKPTSILQSYVTNIKEDAEGNLWVALNGQGLDRYDESSDQFTHFKFQETNDTQLNFRNNVVRDFAFTENGRIVTATFGGINRLDLDENQFEHWDEGISSALKTTSFNATFRIGKATYLTSFAGYIYELGDTSSLPMEVFQISENIRSVFLDKDNMLWLGLTGGKIAYVKTENTYGFNKVGDGNTFVHSLLRTQEELYLGTNKGLILPNGNSFVSNPSLDGKFVIALEEDNDGQLWVGTNASGVAVFDENNGNGSIHRYTPGDYSGLQQDTVIDVYKDSLGTVWVCTQVGLSQWLSDSKTFLTRGRNTFNAMLRIDDEIWCATNQGVVVQDLKTNSFYTKQSSLEQHKDSILHSSVRSLYTPNNDSILIGTISGLNIYIKSKRKMINVHKVTNIPDVNFKGIVQDHYKKYWALTNQGILHFDLRSGEFEFLDVNSGLDFVSSWGGNNLLFDSENEEILIGGKGGYYRFKPEREISKNPKIDIKITKISAPNKSDESKVEVRPTSLAEDVELEYDESTVSFSYAGIYYQNPSNIKYSYRLKGLDDTWTISEERSTTYNNLPSGEYTFEVKASTNSNVWPENAAIFSFSVNPPIWRTWWAFLLYFLLLVGLALYIIRTFLMRQKLKSQLQFEQMEVEKVQELSDLKSRFFANVSHEFRTPLTLIKGPVTDLLEKNSNQEESRKLRLIKKNVKRLQQLIEQLLDYSKIVENKLPVKRVKRDIFSFARAVSSSFESLAESKAIRYTINIPEQSQLALFDDEKLETILNNIISNAVKFTESGGIVHVMAKIDSPNPLESVFLLEVADSGQGLSSEEKERIFERFYRLEDKVEGTGIGLSLTRELVNMLEGRITVLDNKPKGSVFRVELPISLIDETASEVREDKTQQFALENESIKLEDGNKQSILLVEDNLELREYISEMLEPYGLVLKADNGASGLALASQEVPDIIISDFMMPGMNGGELCRKIRQNEITSHIPFIMLTAKATDEDKIMGLEVGATDYIFKPFDKKELILKVSNIMEQRQQLQKQLQSRMFEKKDITLVDSQQNRFLNKFRELIMENLDKSDLNVNFLSAQMGVSRVQLYRKLMAITGMPTSDFIRNLRIQQAAELLKKDWGNVSEVAYQVGFNNLSYFTKCFKEVYGTTPSQFNKSRI